MGLVEMTFGLEGGIGGLSTPQGHKKKITSTASLQKKLINHQHHKLIFVLRFLNVLKRFLEKGCKWVLTVTQQGQVSQMCQTINQNITKGPQVTFFHQTPQV